MGVLHFGSARNYLKATNFIIYKCELLLYHVKILYGEFKIYLIRHNKSKIAVKWTLVKWTLVKWTTPNIKYLKG